MDPIGAQIGQVEDHPRAAAGVQEWERTYATFLHLSLLTVHALMPVVPALAMWLIKRERSAFIDDHGREAVNFQISIVIYFLVAAGIGAITCSWWILVPLVYILGIVGMIRAAMDAHRGLYHRYPMCLRYVK